MPIVLLYQTVTNVYNRDLRWKFTNLALFDYLGLGQQSLSILVTTNSGSFVGVAAGSHTWQIQHGHCGVLRWHGSWLLPDVVPLYNDHHGHELLCRHTE